MTLTLTHDEVQQYFDMRDDLNYYKQKAEELQSIVNTMNENRSPAYHDMYEELYPPSKPTTPVVKDYLPDVPTVIAAYDAKETRENRQGKAWDDLDIHIIRMAVGKVHPAFMISSLAETLGRTEQSVNSKAHDLGFKVKNDRVVYKHD